MNIISKYFEGFLALLYPKLCIACGNDLYEREDDLCSLCIHNLPYTSFHLDRGHPLMNDLAAQLPLKDIFSCLYFNKGGRVHNMMHNIKYRSQKDAARKIGLIYGTKLKEEIEYRECDIIVPVPMHLKAFRKRGFNQSEYFAEGLAASMNVLCMPNALSVIAHKESQTRKGRMDRYKNVNNVFKLNNSRKPELEGKNILIADDVITTGATLIACGSALLKAAPASIGFITIAWAC